MFYLTKLIKYATGYITVVANGPYCERFLNMINIRDIEIWDLKKTALDEISFKISSKNYALLKEPARKTLTNLSQYKKSGVPFKIMPYKSRLGILVGCILFFILLFTQSLFVWTIDITDNAGLSNYKILNDLEKLGFKRGVLKSKINVNEIENLYLKKSKTLSWISINISGTHANIELRKKTDAPKIIADKTATSVYALRDGVISELLVYEGQKMVDVGDTIRAGDIIVSGEVTTKHGEKRYVHARAYVKAKTMRTFKTTQKLSSVYHQKTGNFKNKYSIYISKLKIPLYFNKNISYNNYDENISRNNISFFGLFDLPIVIEKQSINEIKTVKKAKNKDEALNDAYYEIKRHEIDNLSNVKILSKDVNRSVKDDVLTVTANYYCEEEIGLEKELK